MTPPGATLPLELHNDVMIIDEPLPSTDDLARLVADTFNSANLTVPDDAMVSKAVDARRCTSFVRDGVTGPTGAVGVIKLDSNSVSHELWLTVSEILGGAYNSLAEVRCPNCGFKPSP